MSVHDRVSIRGIDGVRVGRFAHKVNTSVWLFRDGATVIDTGPPNQWPEVERFVSEKPTELILASHHHEDHAGNLARLARPGGPKILAPEQSLELLENGFPIQPYRRLFWGAPEAIRPGSVAKMPAAVSLPDGRRLQAILLPGHSPDMTCLLDTDRGVLFGADLYLARRLRYLRVDENLAGIIESLAMIQSFDFDLLLCSHRGAVKDAKSRLRQKRDFLLSLVSESQDLAARGLSLRAITRRLLGREDAVALGSLGHFSKTNLVRACLRLEQSRLEPGSAEVPRPGGQSAPRARADEP